MCHPNIHDSKGLEQNSDISNFRSFCDSNMKTSLVLLSCLAIAYSAIPRDRFNICDFIDCNATKPPTTKPPPTTKSPPTATPHSKARVVIVITK